MGTHAKFNRSWHNWLVWTEYVGIDDPLLQSFNTSERIRIACAFLHAVRRGDFSPDGHRVKGETAKTTLDHVATTIVTNKEKDPRLDNSGKTSILIDRQTKSYKKIRPQNKTPKSLTSRMLLFHNVTSKNSKKSSNCTLSIFCMQKLRILKDATSQKQTRSIRPCDIEFNLPLTERLSPTPIPCYIRQIMSS